MHLTPWSTNAEDTKILLDTISAMNVLNYQLALNLVDTCFDNTLLVLDKLLLPLQDSEN